MDRAGYQLCLIVGFDVSGVEPEGSTTREIES